jgi:hypothetical protein
MREGSGRGRFLRSRLAAGSCRLAQRQRRGVSLPRAAGPDLHLHHHRSPHGDSRAGNRNGEGATRTGGAVARPANATSPRTPEPSRARCPGSPSTTAPTRSSPSPASPLRPRARKISGSSATSSRSTSSTSTRGSPRWRSRPTFDLARAMTSSAPRRRITPRFLGSETRPQALSPGRQAVRSPPLPPASPPRSPRRSTPRSAPSPPRPSRES